MNEVKMDKVKLLAIVTKNREIHIKEYNESVDGYKKEAIDKIESEMKNLTDKVSSLKAGEFIKVMGISFNLPAPQSFQDEYDQTISMLQDSVDDNIILQRHEYNQYVLDKWEWTANFKHLNTRYTQH
jgi:hypothetical protein